MNTWLCIRSNFGALVISLCLAFGLVLAGCATTGSDESDEAEAETDTEEKAEPAPEEAPEQGGGPLSAIEAKVFTATVVRRSRSNRVYLIASQADAQPSVGRIVLFREGPASVMAFRVLKVYEEKKEFAAKVVRKYENYPYLTAKESFLAIEKISDIASSPPSAEDQKDIKELEGADAGGAADEKDGSEKQDESNDSESPLEDEGPNDEESEWLSLTAQELFPIDLTRQGISAQFGFIRNVKSDGEAFYSKSAGFRYGLCLGRMMLIKKPLLQDYLTLELSAFLYSLSGLDAAGTDAYTVLGGIGSLRYTILTSETMGFFLYGGLLKNTVVVYSDASDDTLNALGSFQPAGGVGLLFRVGPNWEVRVDLGIDLAGVGATLRF